MPQDEYGDGMYYTLCRWDERPQDQIANIIWHPYWFERLLYLALTYEIEQPSEEILIVNDYLVENKNLIIKPCIDRPEEWMLLVIDFLNSLPNRAVMGSLRE
jgi:hypothetical protein